MQKKHILFVSACCLLTNLAAAPCQAKVDLTDEPKPTVYIIPKDVSCTKAQGLTYCLDKDGQPITGEMLKYKKGTLVRRYRMKDGYLDGMGESYDENGYLLQKHPYKNGKLNGTMEFYDRHGKLPDELPYVNGKREGVAKSVSEKTTMKAVYINDKMNGKWIIGDNKTRNKIFDLDMSQDKIISGHYYHLDEKADKRCCAPDDANECINNPEAPCCAEVPVVETKIDKSVVYGVNQKCLEIRYQDPISCDNNPIKELNTNSECQQWLNEDANYNTYKQNLKKQSEEITEELTKQERHRVK